MNTHLSHGGNIPNFKYIEADLKKICESFGVRRLLSFGSVNTDRFGPESDIDLLVKFDKSDFADPFDRISGSESSWKPFSEDRLNLSLKKNLIIRISAKQSIKPKD